jgi:hypothetical protein
MTRAHVRLLGPCFKTGRTGDRPIRHRRQVRRRDTRPLQRRGQRALTTVPSGRSTQQRRGPKPTAYGLPRSADGPTQSGSITPPPRRRPPSPNASDRRRTGRGVPHAESAPTAERFRQRRDRHGTCRRRRGRTACKLNPTCGLCGPLRLPLDGFTYC